MASPKGPDALADSPPGASGPASSRRCKRRGCSKPAGVIPRTYHKSINTAHYLRDPYCSRVCCEKDNGVEPGLPGFYRRNYERVAS